MNRFQIFLLIFLFTGSVMQLDAQRTALLLIDIQEFYFPGGRMALENPEIAGMNAGLILERFRETGAPHCAPRPTGYSGPVAFSLHTARAPRPW